MITAHTDSSPGNCSAALDVYAASGAAQLSSRYLLKTFPCFMICWHWGLGFSRSVEEARWSAGCVCGLGDGEVC